MNKELFVSSTPHETKVGLVEDDLLAEIYLERENEYTLAGSIYKGRVTRVLPGMQSAFVDIGLERDAFLYVSDFMELEEHDDDLTDVVPANRGVQDMRSSSVRTDAAKGADETAASAGPEPILQADTDEGSTEAENLADAPLTTAENAEPGNSEESQNRDRGSWRGRRRRRGGRRDGRDRGPDRSADRDRDRGADRSPEPRFSRPTESRTPSGPPPGYQPILLPGESISKYQRWTQPPAAQEAESVGAAPETRSGPDETPLASAFPEDEPIFASAQTMAEPLHEQHEDSVVAPEEPSEASTSTGWNREFRRTEETAASAPAWAAEASVTPIHETATEEIEEIEEDEVEEQQEEDHEPQARITSEPQHSDQPREAYRQDQSPVFAEPGTMEEETIDEEEADTIHYQSSSDDGYEEFEEETRAANDPGHLNGDAREAVSEIHRASMGEAPAVDGAPAEPEEDSEELELEEAQAEAEAMLDAEARGTGTVDARAEVRAPAATAGYTQRSPRQRPGHDRPGYDRRGERGRRGGGGRRFRRRESAPVPLISDLLKEGQEILVQIAKEPIGKKGARITSHIALPGRFLVYMPTVNHTGVSRKISSEEERQRLKRIILSERENGHGGFIVRTAAQAASEEELRADIRFLKGLWQDIKNRAESSKPPALIYHDLNVVERVLRDQVTADFNVIWVDTEPEYERILRFFNRFQPGMVKRVKLYTKETPLFEQFGLAEEMNKALKSKVWLKSGGYIVINQTEALVAIDINTGKYVGKTQRLEDTIVKTNVDAIKEIVRQIRLRDLGGIIIIDFIDMDERRNRQRVMQALEEELRHDRAPSKTLQFNDFGLVAITRKRVKQSLERTIGAPCPYCQSTGYVKSVTTVCNEIYVEMRKIAKHLEHEDVMLRVHPDVAKELKGNNARLLNEMEELTKRTIIVKSDPAVHQEQFDIN
ncbi:MAG TPA: Rne/Rng family ribonuclease [Candidatus Sulfotelmatobacter sp.]|nr:Rne/Rng family ribonuclease [Candidatus Sulfotelmatobacter sp.]